MVYNSAISNIFAFPRCLEIRDPVKPGCCVANSRMGKCKTPPFPVEILQRMLPQLWLSPTIVKKDGKETRRVTAVPGFSNCGNLLCILCIVFIALITTHDRLQKIGSYHHSTDSLSFSMCPGHDPADFTGTDTEESICSSL